MRPHLSTLLCLIPALALLSAGAAAAQIVSTRFATGLGGSTYLTAPSSDLDRVFVTRRSGVIEILDASTGAARPSPFLSIANVETLASMAFDPDYDLNGLFYVYLRDLSNVVHLIRYEVSVGDPDVANAASAVTLLTFPVTGHWGGWIGFGPDDYLYLHVGDSSDSLSHDAADNGQSIVGELHGNALRLDVDGDDFPADPLRNYAIPPDNPFVGVTGEDEIWAYGLRNPWRGSFDRQTGDYYIADVGQDSREEIDFEPANSLGGRNYGWRLREGSVATPTGPYGGSQPPGGIDPVFEYLHGTGASQGQSITGGYVYRGPIPALQGLYFFADFVNPRIWSIRVNPTTQVASDFRDWTDDLMPDAGIYDQIVSFGEDARGHLYILDLGGDIFRITGPTAVPVTTPVGIGALLIILSCAAFRALRASGSARAPRTEQ